MHALNKAGKGPSLPMLAMTVRRTASPSTHSSSTSWFAPLIPDHTIDTITDTNEGRRVISLAGRRTMRSILLSKDLRRENVRRWPRVSKHRWSDGRTARGERGERDCGSSGCEPTKASPRYLNRFTAATISSNSGVSPGANSSGRSGRPAIGAPSGAFSVVSTSNPSFAGELP